MVSRWVSHHRQPIDRWPAALHVAERTELLLQRTVSTSLAGGPVDTPRPTRTDKVVEVLSKAPPPHWAFSERFEIPAVSRSRSDIASLLTAEPRTQLVRDLERTASSEAPIDVLRVVDGLSKAFIAEIDILIFRTITLEERIAALEDSESFGAAHRLRSDLCRPEVRRRLFETYPGLLRQLHLRSDRWLAACLEMAERLQTDRQVLEQTFEIDARDRLVDARMADGDAHIGGRRVVVLRFASGRRLVYKPRPVESAQQFQTLLALLNRKKLEPRLRTIQFLPCQGYGWMEYVPGRSCTSDAALTRYFRRAGALIAALQVAGATDCHFENVIADGEHPIVVDLETMLRPQVRCISSATDRALCVIEDSVLATGMLPSLDGRDLGALAVEPQQTTLLTTMDLIDAGTPNARVVRIPWRLKDVPSLPLRRGKRINAANYTNDIESGFADAYEIIARHSELLLAPEGIISGLGQSHVRTVLRPTSYYADILSDSSHPEVLYDASELEGVWARLRCCPSDALRSSAVNGELQQLVAADIPYFGLKGNSRTLQLSETGSNSFTLPCSGLELARERLAGMGKLDCKRQRGLLRLSFSASKIPDLSAFAGHDPLQLASVIGDALLSEAIHHDGGVNWLQIVDAHGMNQRNISPSGPWLYDGLLGIGLFLSRLSKATGDDRYRAAAACAVTEVSRQLRNLTVPATPGVFEGLGGVVYAFSHLARLLDDESLLEAAERVAIEIISISECQRLSGDLFSGTAGICLATLALDSVRSSDATERLLDACTNDLTAIVVAPPINERLPFVRGASHGWSGVLLAIARLCATRPSDNLRDSLALAIEREALLTADGVWTDPGDSQHLDQATWCHGAPGAALCRLAAADAVHIEDLEITARSAVETLEKVDLECLPEFGLCHGAPGVIEAILAASVLYPTSTPDLFEMARRRVAQGLTKEVHTFRPGLMTGIAGLGHLLLRIAEPAIPSVLTLDGPIYGAVGKSNLA